MGSSLRLLGQRRFLPLFATQFLNAFNDNLYKMAMIVLVTFTIYADPTKEASFNVLAGGLFILPFFLFSAIAGQLADSRDKAAMIRVIKSAEIVIMLGGALGIWLHSIPLMLAALFAMGVHSSFFGPIKYAILPQHLADDDVLAGTGWVEAGTYLAILGGSVVGGILPAHWSMVAVVLVAIAGRAVAQGVPAAPPERDGRTLVIDPNVVRSSWRLVRATMHVPRLFLAIIAISFFWAIAAILAAQFPPLVKNALGADNTVATMFTALFSIGVAVGSVIVNKLLKGEVSARYAMPSVLVMALFVLDLWWSVGHWPHGDGALLDWRGFIALGAGDRIMVDLIGIATFGGMFVVPLYAFLTTTVPKAETARTVAANNIVNSAFMVAAAMLLGLLISVGMTIDDTLLLVAGMCGVSALLAHRLHLVARRA